MNRQEFFYDLPEALIAQHPLKDRDAARLMVIDRASGKIAHSHFRDLAKFLPPESLLIVNDSKVVPARLLGSKERSGGKVEIFLLKKFSDGYTYEALLRPLKKIKSGDVVVFENSLLKAFIVDAQARLVKFNFKNVTPHLNRIGHMPLPPYIKRADTLSDREDYQTVYAKKDGSVAAPTAGLHFTRERLSSLAKAGHEILKTTLHVNYATFQLVEEDDITRHRMHSEEYEISPLVFRKIQQAKKAGRRIIAVGTTSCRVLESAAQTGKLKGETRIFIYPGYPFKMIDGLITNFHLPYSTLLMLVFAFGGTDLMKKAYKEAIEKKYRFFSYGDCMVIL